MSLLQQYQTISHFTKTAPVDVEGIAIALGLDVSYSPLHADISGMIEKTESGGHRIVINRSDSRTRQRFTLAHELGHFMFHRHLIGDGIDDDRAYRSADVGKYHNTAIGRLEETEANKFAASLLMPKNLIDAERVVNSDPEHLARKFNVSPQSMRIRLGL